MTKITEQCFKQNQDAFYSNGYAKSVHYTDKERFSIAQREIKKKPVSLKKIVKYVNKVFDFCGIKRIKYKQAIRNPNDINYEDLCSIYNLEDKKDIIWMKFTKSGHLGVVAAGNDVNFEIPPNESQYNVKTSKNKNWKYNISGILVHSVGQEWDESFVLIFPLKRLNDSRNYKRHDLEIAIGNYLEKMGVPIIDYYSHNYGK